MSIVYAYVFFVSISIHTCVSFINLWALNIDWWLLCPFFSTCILFLTLGPSCLRFASLGLQKSLWVSDLVLAVFGFRVIRLTGMMWTSAVMRRFAKNEGRRSGLLNDEATGSGRIPRYTCQSTYVCSRSSIYVYVYIDIYRYIYIYIYICIYYVYIICIYIYI